MSVGEGIRDRSVASRRGIVCFFARGRSVKECFVRRVVNRRRFVAGSYPEDPPPDPAVSCAPRDPSIRPGRGGGEGARASRAGTVAHARWDAAGSRARGRGRGGGGRGPGARAGRFARRALAPRGGAPRERKTRARHQPSLEKRARGRSPVASRRARGRRRTFVPDVLQQLLRRRRARAILHDEEHLRGRWRGRDRERGRVERGGVERGNTVLARYGGLGAGAMTIPGSGTDPGERARRSRRSPHAP